MKTLNKNMIVCAQNAGAQGNGAYTGEVSADMLVDMGMQWVMLGHSERRTIFKEDMDMVGQKVKYCMEKGMHVILCIGEMLNERETGKTQEVLQHQLDACKDSIKDWTKVVIAYEPVWAIGTGKVATPEEAQETMSFVRAWINDNVSGDAATSTRIIYGGSVTETNCGDLIKKPDIDGFLVGGASLKPSFAEIVKITSTC